MEKCRRIGPARAPTGPGRGAERPKSGSTDQERGQTWQYEPEIRCAGGRVRLRYMRRDGQNGNPGSEVGDVDPVVHAELRISDPVFHVGAGFEAGIEGLANIGAMIAVRILQPKDVRHRRDDEASIPGQHTLGSKQVIDKDGPFVDPPGR